MDNLDQVQLFKELDKEGMLQHIEELPDQIEQAWKELQDFVIPTPYIKVKNIVILGMGGSGVGSILAKYLSTSKTSVPIDVVLDYVLPEYVSSDSLVIGVSYSGQTEETLTTFKEAAKKQAKLIAITVGGELASLASRFKAPVYRINYGSPPRAALGYNYTAVLAILNKLGFLELKKDDISEAIVLMRGLKKKLAPDVPTYQNDAKKLAQALYGKIPMIMGSGLLYPVAYRWATMLNENSKQMGMPIMLPELCHNWLSGLKFPVGINDAIYVVMLQSKFDHARNRARQNIISQILRKSNIKHEFVFMQPSGSELSEQLLTLYLGDYVSYYLAMLNNVDPTSIEEVVYLKKNLESMKTE